MGSLKWKQKKGTIGRLVKWRIGGIVIDSIRKYLFSKFDKDWERDLTKYGGYATICVVSLVT